MNLELKHIAPYLPYGLKVLRPDGVTILNADGLLGTLVQHKEKDRITYSSLSGCRPLLRPLSDLYKEIEGVVPIVELAKVMGLNFKRYELGNSCVDLYLIDRKDKKSRFWYDSFKTGTFCITIYGYGKLNQLSGFNYLFSYHFDVYGLIDEGLAININDLTTK